MNYTYAEIGLINGSTLWVDVSGPPRASTCDFCQKKEALTFGIGPTDDLTATGGVKDFTPARSCCLARFIKPGKIWLVRKCGLPRLPVSCIPKRRNK